MKPVELFKIHDLLADRTRLAIMAELASAGEPVDFNTLLEHLGVTKGNLSSHILKLEQNGLVSVRKEFVDRKPRTTYVCTTAGRKEVEAYLARIEAVLKAALGPAGKKGK